MFILRYVYIVPLLAASGIIFRYLVRNRNKYKADVLRFIKKRYFAVNTFKFTGRLIKKDSRLYLFYSGSLLKHADFDIDTLFQVKFVIFVFVLGIAWLVKYTDITMQTRDILSKFDYSIDPVFEYKNIKDKDAAMKQEMEFFKKSLQKIKAEDLKNTAADVQADIKSLISGSDSELVLPKDTLASKIYHRLTDYYAVRKLKPFLYILSAFVLSFTPEIYFLTYNILVKADERKELRFLKKLMIMNGSIPPVDFMGVLNCLIEKSKYYKRILEEIGDNNRKNSVDTKAIYKKFISETQDINEKLFFEKLDEANNSKFEQAITNIENEFRLEKREVQRNIRKRIEVIHAMGVMGMMVIITIMVLYLIMPWMKAYNSNQMGF